MDVNIGETDKWEMDNGRKNLGSISFVGEQYFHFVRFVIIFLYFVLV